MSGADLLYAAGREWGRVAAAVRARNFSTLIVFELTG